MPNQLTSNAEALRLFFTEEVYLVEDKMMDMTVAEQDKPDALVSSVIAPTVTKDEPISVPTKEAVPQVIDFEYLGKNQKGILILVHDHNHKVSSPQGTELLRKLVKAIELTNNDFALVNYANYPDTSFEALRQHFNCKLLLSFGVEAHQLTLADQPLHQLGEHETVRLVFTSNLHDLDSDQTAKKMLWATLQKLK